MNQLNSVLHDAKKFYYAGATPTQLQPFYEVIKEDGYPITMFSCVFEGICCWNDKQSYQLIYPMSALRLLFHECRQQTKRESGEKLALVQQFLDQAITVHCNVRIQQTSKTEFRQLSIIERLFDKFELKPCQFQQVKWSDDQSQVSISVKCIRCPQWQFSPPNCLSNGCTNKGIIKNNGTCWDGNFCQDHEPQNNSKANRDDEQEEAHCGHRREFLAYPTRPDLEIKDYSFTIADNVWNVEITKVEYSIP